MSLSLHCSAPNLRSGRMNPTWLLLLGALGLSAVLVTMLVAGKYNTSESANSLTFYCAAGMRFPAEEIAARYEQEYGIPVNIQFGGSNTLLNQIMVNQFESADLYLAADDFYIAQAVKENLVAESMPVAYQRPVIAVPQGNPKNIGSIEDLLQEGVFVSVANPEQAAVGRATQAALSRVSRGGTTLWQQLKLHVTEQGVFKPTVNEVATDVKLGAVDAGIVWDSTMSMPDYRDDLTMIEVPQFDTDPKLISLAVLKSSPRPTAALMFARYLTARDKGLPSFAKYGTRPVEGELWEDHSQVNYNGSTVNRLDTDLDSQQ